jgi:ribonucleoside-diphosphate reductase alpha chain
MATKFLSPEAQWDAGVNIPDPHDHAVAAPASSVTVAAAAPPSIGTKSAGGYQGAAIQSQEDAPPCSTCGSIMIRSGSCYKCANCGTTSGCA